MATPARFDFRPPGGRNRLRIRTVLVSCLWASKSSLDIGARTLCSESCPYLKSTFADNPVIPLIRLYCAIHT